MEEYQQIVSRARSEGIGRGSKIYFGGDPDTMNISAISNISNNLSSLSTTVLNKGFNVNIDVYKPDVYRLITQSTSKVKPNRHN
jgi:chemotaxis protein CheY-P-specific phosphatase CheC